MGSSRWRCSWSCSTTSWCRRAAHDPPRPRRLDPVAGVDRQRLRAGLRGAAADRRRARRPLRAQAHVPGGALRCSPPPPLAPRWRPAPSCSWPPARCRGAGAAMVTPLTLTLLAEAFPAARRGMALGVWSGVSGIGRRARPAGGRRRRAGHLLALDLLDQRPDRPRADAAGRAPAAREPRPLRHARPARPGAGVHRRVRHRVRPRARAVARLDLHHDPRLVERAAPCCWRYSSPGSGVRASRCCRCHSSPNAPSR